MKALIIAFLCFSDTPLMAMDAENFIPLNTGTMMEVTFGDKAYTLRVGYQKDDKQRLAFDALVEKTFNISFEEWYRTGYWNDKCIPYTLFDGERAIANVSVNMLAFDAFGQSHRYIQLGTVMTDKDYRNQKLNRFLMEFVLKEWQEKCDLIYLFANSSVLEMYPKFGFEAVKEYEYYKPLKKASGSSHFAKLDMSRHTDRAMLHNYAANSKAMGLFSMAENADLIMYYCTSFLKDSVYYIEAMDAIAIAQFKDNLLHLWDVFTKGEVELDEIISSLLTPDVDQVLLGFTPKDQSGYEVKEIAGDDTLFVQKGKTDVFEKNKLMFPLLSHT